MSPFTAFGRSRRARANRDLGHTRGFNLFGDGHADDAVVNRGGDLCRVRIAREWERANELPKAALDTVKSISLLLVLPLALPADANHVPVGDLHLDVVGSKPRRIGLQDVGLLQRVRNKNIIVSIPGSP
jgi:hypothetical protein